MLAMERCLMSKQRRSLSPEFKAQAACLVLDKGYSHIEASRSVGVAESVLRRWVQQLQMERQGITPQSKSVLSMWIASIWRYAAACASCSSRAEARRAAAASWA